jgi:hypothetical protein
MTGDLEKSSSIIHRIIAKSKADVHIYSYSL